MATGKYNNSIKKIVKKMLPSLKNQSPNAGVQISSDFFFPKFAIAFRINGDIAK